MIELEKVQEFYKYLQGEISEDTKLINPFAPKLNSKDAFSVIYYMQEHLRIFSDYIEKCSICGELYDSLEGGDYIEGDSKFYCDGCSHLIDDKKERE